MEKEKTGKTGEEIGRAMSNEKHKEEIEGRGRRRKRGTRRRRSRRRPKFEK